MSSKRITPRAADCLRLAKAGAVALAFSFGSAAIAQGSGAAGAPTKVPTERSGEAPGTVHNTAGATKALASADVAFMKQAAENNAMEIEASKLALQKAADAKVKSFAQKMVDDHTKKSSELKALASSKGVELPDGPSLIQKGKMNLLEAAKGGDFDIGYVQTVGLTAHRETIELFEKAAQEVKDPQIKGFATKTIPALKQHLTMAEQLAAQIPGAASDAPKSR